MGTFYARLALVTAILFQFSATVSAGPLDDYYLQQFGEPNNTQLQKAILGDSSGAHVAARCGMPLNKGLRRDWDLLEPSTQKVLAKQLAAPALLTEKTFNSAGGHFTVHYATAPPTDPSVPDDRPPMTDLNNNEVPDWVETVAAIFENVYTSYGAMGYRPAPTSGGAPYDIYLLDLAPQKYYGVTHSGGRVSSTGFPNAFSSWMEIDNNFTDSIYSPYTPPQSLQITAAHEYHHAIQYGYNYYFDVWYGEATSTWLEDELYDDVNQLYDYIPDWFAQSYLSLDITESTTTGGGYGRWIFNRYLSEQHSPTMIRGVWEKLAGLFSPGNNADIPMAPVLDSVLSSTYASTLGNDFFGFTKRVYQRDWTDHKYDINNIHPYSPLVSYSVGTTPVSAGTTPAPSVTLPHYSFAYYRFVPTSGAPTDLDITITGTSGIKAAAFRKNGSSIVEFPFAGVDAKTITTVPGFSTSTEVVLLIANVTDVDNHSANFSTNDTGVSVTDPSGGTVYPPPPATPTNTSSGGGGGGGCFIATAAYGSYLHPQVQLLRDFRDKYLLTNAPGRAFVTFYYRCSPPLADLIARHPLLRGVTRLALTPLVAAVAHPLISAVALFLVAGALLRSLRRRINAARSNIHPHVIRVTQSTTS